MQEDTLESILLKKLQDINIDDADVIIKSLDFTLAKTEEEIQRFSGLPEGNILSHLASLEMLENYKNKITTAKGKIEILFATKLFLEKERSTEH